MRSKDQFSMIELGAARGSWLVRADAAVKQTSNIPVVLVAVEGSDNRWNWMREHFIVNGINPDDHRLIYGLVTAEDGFAYFLEADDPADMGYGDRVIGGEHEFKKVRKELGIKETTLEFGVKVKTKLPGKRCIKLPGISLATLMEPMDRVDLIHMDVQGEEFNILSAAIEAVTEKAKTICIGTHSESIEQNLRILMSQHGWLPRYDFGRRTTWATDWGKIVFRDGCQVWINDNLEL
ncbi:MAG: hypothetical protein GY950_15495 [bacterium]|nr:hypothetical protein [bacterium]